MESERRRFRFPDRQGGGRRPPRSVRSTAARGSAGFTITASSSSGESCSTVTVTDPNLHRAPRAARAAVDAERDTLQVQAEQSTVNKNSSRLFLFLFTARDDAGWPPVRARARRGRTCGPDRWTWTQRRRGIHESIHGAAGQVPSCSSALLPPGGEASSLHPSFSAMEAGMNRAGASRKLLYASTDGTDQSRRPAMAPSCPSTCGAEPRPSSSWVGGSSYIFAMGIISTWMN
jgi:hypothetical protein